ncbi:MAG: hypothetical protein J7599_08555 [Niabella sp.]|nr:hypothetical protein [Niabella sp.]
MKKNYLFMMVTLLVLGSINKGYAQPLLAGDIAFVGYNAINPGNDESAFTFVILKNGGIANNTTINFTDNGWNTALPTAALGTMEGVIVWTSSGALPQFTQVTIKATGQVTSTLTASSGTVSYFGSGVFVLSQAGDQVLAFRDAVTSPTFIAGIHMNSEILSGTQLASTYANWDAVGGTSWSYNQNRSAKPPGLTTGVNAIMGVLSPGTNGAEFDNGIVKCSATSAGSIATLRSQINNPNNWDLKSAGGTPYPLPATCVFSISLPVSFGAAEASVQNGVLHVNWITESEKQSDHFDVEASVDGLAFHKIGSVASKAAAGNATAEIRYQFEIDLQSGNALLGAGIASMLGLIIAAGRRRSGVQALLAVVVLVLIIASCSKETSVPVDKDKELYIRIRQVNRDGTVQYSKVLKAGID